MTRTFFKILPLILLATTALAARTTLPAADGEPFSVRTADPAPAEAAPCTGEEMDDFDFLLGEWREAEGGATMEISKILDGCIVREIWNFPDFKAVLLRNHDGRTKRWYLTFTAHDLVPQVWEGRREKGGWVFYRDWELDGRARRSRTYWEPVSGGGFVKIVEQLNDDGRTWRPHARSVFGKAPEPKTDSKNKDTQGEKNQ